MKEYFDQKFQELWHQERDASIAVPTLQGKGNKSQAECIVEVMNLLTKIESKMKNGNTREASKDIKKARKVLEKRLKLIRIADKSENGWLTVEQYLSDELASDSEDDKRIKKAEAAATMKRKRMSEEKNRRQNKDRVENVTSQQQFFRGFKKQKLFNQNDRCFSCGRQGHWVQDCPEKIGSSSHTKIHMQPKADLQRQNL